MDKFDASFNQKIQSGLRLFGKISLIANISILIITGLLGLHPGLFISIIPLIIYHIPLILLSLPKSKISFQYWQYIRLASLAHIVLVVVSIVLILVFLIVPGLAIIPIFGLGGIVISWMGSYGMGLIFLIQGFVWTIFISRYNHVLKKESSFKARLNIESILFLLFYLPVLIFIYTVFQFFLIPSTSAFWDSWIFN